MEYIPFSAQNIFDDNIKSLTLTWLTGHEGADRVMNEDTVREATSAADLVGHLNLIHPHRIQVLGELEITYYKNLSENEEKEQMARLMRLNPPFILIAEGVEPPPELALRCMRSSTPLFSTPISSATAIDELRSYLTKLFAPKISLHGVFMDILGLGVLIIGESGLGKSELGLELISRGHGLVADDAVDFVRLGPDFVEGRCPTLLQNLLEVRGLGLLDIKTIFGETAVRRKMKLKLVVQLVRRNDGTFERLPLDQQATEILGLAIPKVSIQVAEGRNMAVLVEAAVRNSILKLRGIDTLKDFMDRQRDEMQRHEQQGPQQKKLL